MGKLRITRENGNVDLFRLYQVVLDGEKVGTLRRGETKDFEFAPGPHEVRLTIDWCSSNTVLFDGTEEMVLLDC